MDCEIRVRQGSWRCRDCFGGGVIACNAFCEQHRLPSPHKAQHWIAISFLTCLAVPGGSDSESRPLSVERDVLSSSGREPEHPQVPPTACHRTVAISGDSQGSLPPICEMKAWTGRTKNMHSGRATGASALARYQGSWVSC